MNFNELKMGTRLDLVLNNEKSDVEKPLLVSEFEWADENNQVYIAAPILEGVIYPIKIGSYVDAFFIDKLELYKFRAEIVSRGVKDNISLLKIKIRSDFERIQRRQFYRFDSSIPIKYMEINASEDDDARPCKKTITRDLSGGGLCILTDEKFEIGVLLEFELKLEENTVIHFTGKVVRCSLSELNEKFKYELGISFRKIENKDREAVIRYIFNEQRKLRQKGLI